MPANETPSVRLQPMPIYYQVGTLDGVTAITRHWSEGDSARCHLCDVCTARRNVCTVLTTEAVTEGGAPLYSSCGLDSDDDGRAGSLIRPTLCVR